MASLNTLFAKIAETQKLYLPIEKAGQVDFYEWNENEKVRLDVLKTVRSAKDVFFPQVEDLIKFRVEGKSISISECPKNEDDFVVFGVRGCDAKSFEILDRVFLVDPAMNFMLPAAHTPRWSLWPVANRIPPASARISA